LNVSKKTDTFIIEKVIRKELYIKEEIIL